MGEESKFNLVVSCGGGWGGGGGWRVFWKLAGGDKTVKQEKTKL